MNDKPMSPDTVLELDVQLATTSQIPGESSFHQWILAALVEDQKKVEMVVRVVNAQESQELNKQYRHADKPTNVLSFPFDAPAQIVSDNLGDLVICAPVVEREALEQGKDSTAHWAHLVIHGVLHLQGYDHQNETQAENMEALEIRVLNGLGFDNPYRAR